MTNRQRYEQDINNGNPDYRVTVTAFGAWLDEAQMRELFHKMLTDRDLTEYDIALDFSIPIVMVKYFKRSA